MAGDRAVSRQEAYDPIQEEATELQRILSTARKVLAENPDEDVAAQAPGASDEFVQVVGRTQRLLDAVWVRDPMLTTEAGVLLEATKRHALPIIARLMHDISVSSDSFRMNSWLLYLLLEAAGAKVPLYCEYRRIREILEGRSPVVKFYPQIGRIFTLESGAKSLKLQDLMDYVVLMKEYAIEPLRNDMWRAIIEWGKHIPAPARPAGTREILRLPPSSAPYSERFRMTYSEIVQRFERAREDIETWQPISGIYESLVAGTSTVNALSSEVAASLASLDLSNNFAYYTQLARDTTLSPLLLSGMIFCPPSRPVA